MKKSGIPSVKCAFLPYVDGMKCIIKKLIDINLPKKPLGKLNSSNENST